MDSDAIILQPRERVLIRALVEQKGKVIGRRELARLVGLSRTPRRVDVHLVAIRRVLGEALVNVRSRGWMLATDFDESTVADLLRNDESAVTT